MQAKEICNQAEADALGLLQKLKQSEDEKRDLQSKLDQQAVSDVCEPVGR